jgi:hypothetical protein
VHSLGSPRNHRPPPKAASPKVGASPKTGGSPEKPPSPEKPAAAVCLHPRSFVGDCHASLLTFVSESLSITPPSQGFEETLEAWGENVEQLLGQAVGEKACAGAALQSWLREYKTRQRAKPDTQVEWEVGEVSLQLHHARHGPLVGASLRRVEGSFKRFEDSSARMEVDLGTLLVEDCRGGNGPLSGGGVQGPMQQAGGAVGPMGGALIVFPAVIKRGASHVRVTSGDFDQ